MYIVLAGTKQFVKEPWFQAAPEEWVGQIMRVVHSEGETPPSADVVVSIGKVPAGHFVPYHKFRASVHMAGVDYETFLTVKDNPANLEALVLDIMTNPRPRMRPDA